jgi:hypothetical protein
MTVADVVEEIRQGARRGPENEEALQRGEEREDPDDALQLCLGMAMAIQLQGRTWRIFEDALDLAGRILCPIFDYAKPAQYRTAMRALRLQYRGVARDAELQRAWFEQVSPLVGDGVLESVQSAVDAQVWRGLGRDLGVRA